MADDDDSRQTSLDDLSERIARGRQAAGLTPSADKSSATAGMGQGFRIAIEFVVATLIGAGLGYLIGKWLGQPTIGVVLGLLIGFGAGMRNVYRMMVQSPAAAARPAEDEDKGDNGRND